MPELPEVETIVRHLRPKIRGKRILSVWSNTPRLFRKVKPGRSDFPRFHNFRKSDLQKFLANRKIIGVRREGKNIVLELSGGYDLYIHLMMTGKLLWNPVRSSRAAVLRTRAKGAGATSNGVDPQNIREPHIRFWMKLSGNDILALHDIRKFGWMRLISRGRGATGAPAARNLGPDALELTLKKFKSLISGRRGAIKNVLLNQKIISGIGNIYSDEILWYAGIKPTRRAGSLSEKEIRALYAAMKKVLKLAIRKEGTSSRDYRKPDGSEGGYYKIRKAYQRAGEKCSRCGGIIKRVVIGQRSAHFCLKHQK